MISTRLSDKIAELERRRPNWGRREWLEFAAHQCLLVEGYKRPSPFKSDYFGYTDDYFGHRHNTYTQPK